MSDPAATQPSAEPAPTTAPLVKAAADDDDELDVPLVQLMAAKVKKSASSSNSSSSSKKRAPAEADASSEDIPLAAMAIKDKKPKSAAAPKRKAPAATDDDFKKKPAQSKAPAAKATPSPAPPAKAKKAAATPKKRVKKEAEADDEDGASSSEDVPLGQVVAKPKKKAAKKTEGASASGEKKKKKADEPDEEVWEWWNEPPLPAGKKWRTLEHNGVIFPPPYEPHGVKMLYDGVPIALNAEAEERATHYARYLETPHVAKAAFRNNFFREFKEVANAKRPQGAPKIASLDLCDFGPIKAHLDAEKERKKNRTKEEKDAEKAEKKKLQDKYGWCVLDGHRQKVGNYMVEPPGLFLGRGAHPKTGTWKKRLTPADVTLNLGNDAPVPPCPVEGASWGEIVHKDTVTWLAGWQESVQDAFKYVMLSASSRTKGQSDMAKFEKARTLKTHIEKIRKAYTKDFTDSDQLTRQRAVILYLIDKLALRVGGEKDTSSAADTVGCCSLRVEHVTLKAPNLLTLDFLGKDSMRYYSTVEVLPAVYKCLSAFVKGKKGSDELFDLVTPAILNEHLKTYMDGLSAKVFRTFNASITLQRELEKTPADGTVEEKVAYYNKANKEVALLCNHKRTVPAKFAESIKKMDDEITAIETELEELEAHKVRVEAGQKPLKREPDAEGNERPVLPTDPDKIAAKVEALEDRLKKKKIAKADKEENSEVALGTSKINYNDPRITAAWCKKYDVPWSKVFSPTLRAKFPWAQMAESDWVF